MSIQRIITFFFREKVLLTFICVSLGYAFVYALALRQYTNTFVILLTGVFTAVPFLLKHRYHVPLPRAIVLFAVLFSYGTLFLGEIKHFYDRLPWWDTLMHGSSALILGLIGLGIIRMMIHAHTVIASPGTVSIFAFAFALAIGTLWEIIEFIIDLLFATHMQTNSLIDTMGDLMTDAVGAFIVVSLAYFHWKYHRYNVVGRAIDDFIQRYEEDAS